MNLDEIDEKALLDELLRRHRAREDGACDYCGKARDSEPSCARPERHERRESGEKLEVSCSCGNKRTIRQTDGGWLCSLCKRLSLRVPAAEPYEGDAEFVEWDPQKEFVFTKREFDLEGKPLEASGKRWIDLLPGSETNLRLAGTESEVRIAYTGNGLAVTTKTPTAKKLKALSRSIPQHWLPVKIRVQLRDGPDVRSTTLLLDPSHPMATKDGIERGWQASIDTKG